MEPKKTHRADLHRHRPTILAAGYLVALAIVVVCFKLTFPATTDVQEQALADLAVATHTHQEEVLTRNYKSQQTDPVKKAATRQKAINFVETRNQQDPARELVFNFGYEDEPDTPAGTDSLIIEAEDETTIFFPGIVERDPEPVGGYQAFYKQLQKQLKYPRQAQRLGIDGKVFVEFVVDRNGSVTDARIIRGIGHGCDEEALRVVGLTRWEPGKQRGKPVRVRMVVPINFVLGR